MYSILIVDDERFTREGIAKLMPWNLLRIDHVETADSGSKALAKMQQHMPDLVLTDIEMKNMTGLELIKQMNQLNPQLRIIVLTGHNDFAYVQECCRMEVQDYLLKPVDTDKLIEAVGAQVEALDRMAEEKTRKKSIDRANGLAEQTRVEAAFHQFFHKGTGAAEISQILREYGYSGRESFQVAIIAPEGGRSMEAPESAYELLDLSVNSACIELVEYHHDGVSFRDENNAMVLVLFRGDKHPSSQELLDQLQDVLHHEYGTRQRIYQGSVVASISELPSSYQEAVRLWDNKQKATAQMASEETSKQAVYSLQEQFCRAMEQQMDSPHSVIQLFYDYCVRLESGLLPIELLRRSCFQLLSEVTYSWAEKTGDSVAQPLAELMSAIQTADESGVREAGCDYLERLMLNGAESSDDVISNAKRYIERHLREPLSVSSLAEQYYLSVAYFSKLFKKTEGMGCNYYIICKRMEKARQMLTSSSAKVSTVAEEVGYRDVNYFSLAFKKYTGMSPAEYRAAGEEKHE